MFFDHFTVLFNRNFAPPTMAQHFRTLTSISTRWGRLQFFFIFTQRPHSRSIQGSSIRQEMELSPWISACASYKSNSSLAFATSTVFLYTAHLIHLSQWHHLSHWHPLPLLLLTMFSRGLTRTVVKVYYLTPGVSFTDSRFTLLRSLTLSNCSPSTFSLSDHNCAEWAQRHHYVACSST